MSANGVPGPAPREHRVRGFWLMVKVIEVRLRFVAVLVATGLAFAYWDELWGRYEKWRRPAASESAAVAASTTEYYCPMHPAVVQETPGTCPQCGMPLSQRKKGSTEPLPEGVLARVDLAPQRVAQGGVRTVAADYAPLAETITAVGRVDYDERRRALISSRIKGMSRVDKLYVDFNGISVKANQVLAELYNPELDQAFQELLIAKNSGSSRLLGGEEAAQAAREKLKRWGIGKAQIDKVLAEGRAPTSFPVLAPFAGHVIRKEVTLGQYVPEGQILFEVVDLSRVWVIAQVPEAQLGMVQIGQEVSAVVSSYPDEAFRGKAAFIQPHMDTATRTNEVRFDLANAQGRLHPGMTATVTLSTPIARTPAFAAKLAKGAPKDPLAMTVEDQKTCPVTDQPLGEMGPPVSMVVEGRKVWLCCEGCDQSIHKEPKKYLAKLTGPPKDMVLAIPESAVIDTGTRKVVYVESSPGTFDGRAVSLGPLSGGMYPVLDGIKPGEKIAAAGAFLIDAETRLNPGAGATYFGSSAPSTPAAAHAGHAH